jgi:hypothetical protein
MVEGTLEAPLRDGMLCICLHQCQFPLGDMHSVTLDKGTRGSLYYFLQLYVNLQLPQSKTFFNAGWKAHIYNPST